MFECRFYLFCWFFCFLASPIWLCSIGEVISNRIYCRIHYYCLTFICWAVFAVDVFTWFARKIHIPIQLCRPDMLSMKNTHAHTLHVSMSILLNLFRRIWAPCTYSIAVHSIVSYVNNTRKRVENWIHIRFESPRSWVAMKIFCCSLSSMRTPEWFCV